MRDGNDGGEEVMDIRDYDEGASSVLQLRGRLDAGTAGAVEAKLTAMAGLGRPLVIDLGELSYISSIGLRVLLQAAKRAQAAKLGFALAAPQPPVKEVFHITGLDGILTIHDDLADALGKAE
jgi:anti-anti-sigma factor